jgi:hypothetical protein
MKHFIFVALTSMALLGSGNTAAQVAGSTTVGVTAAEMKEIVLGWSAKQQLLGKNIYNENNEKIGKVEDIIIAPDKSISYLIISAGGFVGLGKHDVAIPIAQVQE